MSSKYWDSSFIDKCLEKQQETVPPCVICGKIHQRKTAGEEWVYHNSKGVVCLNHVGVKEWYNELLAKTDNNMIYYWETENRNGRFEAPTDEKALERAKKTIKSLWCLYRESDTKDGLPFIMLYDWKELRSKDD